jgi:hypothetical protein
MDTDLFLVIGIIVTFLAVPPVVGAFSEARPPRTGAIMFLIGGTLIVLALTQGSIKYSVPDIPDVFARVIGRYLN